MTSYKNVTKYQYTQNPTDVVSLKEYILFDSDKDGGKFALLKFVNNLDQKLYAVEFEARQFDENGSLIAKSLLVYDKFTADAGETFVPKAKLRLGANCTSISVKLISARFDRVRWEKGGFSDNSYKFDRFVADEAKAAKNTDSDKRKDQSDYRIEKTEKSARKKDDAKPVKPFGSCNIYRENYAKFPQVFAIIIAVLVIAFSAAMAFYVRKTSKEFSIGEFDVVRVSSLEVGIVGYDGKNKDVVIPARLGDYNVVRIGENAFANSKITSVKFETEDFDVTVSANAFYKCESLTSVRSSGKSTVLVMGYGFNKCVNIEEISMPNGYVSSKGFSGCKNVKRCDIGKSGSYEEIFGA